MILLINPLNLSYRMDVIYVRLVMRAMVSQRRRGYEAQAFVYLNNASNKHNCVP